MVLSPNRPMSASSTRTGMASFWRNCAATRAATADERRYRRAASRRPALSPRRTRSVQSNHRFRLMVPLLVRGQLVERVNARIISRREMTTLALRAGVPVPQRSASRLVTPQNVCLSREAETVLDALEASLVQFFAHALGGQIVKAAGTSLALEPASVGPHAPG